MSLSLSQEQFNKLSTKKDLEKLATKKDLKESRQETKKDLEELRQETKSDLDEYAVRAFNIFSTKEDLKELRQDITQEISEKIDKVLTAIDGVAKEQQDSRMERTANIGAHDRIEADIVKTNKRVTVVEKRIEAISVAR